MSTNVPTLDQLDPAEAWKPWTPTAGDPWGRKWAAHLYRRAGFGPSRDDLLESERLGVGGTLDLLIRGRPESEEATATLLDVGRIAADADDGEGDPLRAWWLDAMLRSGHPLREKMTLFWHDHFATSLAKVSSPQRMFAQNCLLRQHALGRFDPLLQAISRDPAMLIWLDSGSNLKGRPNENYARELMELFSLGVGPYTEHDVREAARAFTGWRPERGGGFTFDPARHDDGTKTVLGQTGRWDGGDVVRIVLEQPASARFLVRKLYRFLVSERAVPPDSLLEPLCAGFRASGHDISALVRTMLASRHFYSAHAFRQRIKGPVEFVLGALREAYQVQGEGKGQASDRRLPLLALAVRISAMGQALFAPPNVKGWPGGASWLNTSTLLERSNFAGALATGTLWRGSAPGEDPAPPSAFDPARILADERVDRPATIADSLLERYLPGGARPEVRSSLIAFLSHGDPTGTALARRVREGVHALMTAAEYQLA